MKQREIKFYEDKVEKKIFASVIFNGTSVVSV
jgi:hypothetical protein